MWKKLVLFFILCVGLFFVSCEKKPAEEPEPEVTEMEVTEEESTNEVDLGEYTVMEVADRIYLRGEDDENYVILETDADVSPGQRIRCFGEEKASEPGKLVATRCEILDKSPAKIPMYRKLYREMWKQGDDITGGADTVYFEFKKGMESELFPDPLEQKLLMELFAEEVGLDVTFLPEDYEYTEDGMEHSVLLTLSNEPSEFRGDNQMQLSLYRGPLAAWFYVFSMEEKGGEYFYTIDEMMVS